MKLVLQCAMCGTHHPVGTAVCSTCRASGIAQLRLMFECQTCGQLGLNPTCAACSEELAVAEELEEEPYVLVSGDEPEEEEFEFDFEEEEDKPADDEVFVLDDEDLSDVAEAESEIKDKDGDS